MSVLADTNTREALRRAWEDSQPGTEQAHEEGGFVLRRDDGSMTVSRWPRGQQDRIIVPEHPGGRFEGALIVASFHTHPNTGSDYQQEPSLTDIRAVRDDPDLRHTDYEGEYVLSQDWVYIIRPPGSVDTVGETKSVLFGADMTAGG